MKKRLSWIRTTVPHLDYVISEDDAIKMNGTQYTGGGQTWHTYRSKGLDVETRLPIYTPFNYVSVIFDKIVSIEHLGECLIKEAE